MTLIAYSHVVLARHLYFDQDDRDVLHGVSLALPRGTVTAVAEPNGSGKSTLIELLAACACVTHDDASIEQADHVVRLQDGRLL